jgi:hypothetical protein
MIIINTLLCVVLGLLSIIEATVTCPSASTVLTNGGIVQITWNGIPGNAVTIVLTRTNTIFHHTIVSYAPNSGIYTWQVQIPPQDGWPSSTSSDLVYEIDFYINGGWNNGGTLVARSQQFAIQWSGSRNVVTTPFLITNSPSSATGLVTTVQTLTNAQTTTVQTTIIGATTIGATTPSPQAQQLSNSGMRNSGSSAFMNVLGIIMGATLMFG